MSRSVPCLLGALCIVAFPGCSENSDRTDVACSHHDFDGSAWAGGKAQRLAEARVVSRCGTLDGFTKARVRRTLGAPAHGPAFSEQKWGYLLGVVRSGFGFGDDRALVIRFGADGAVSEASVQTGF